MAQSSLGVAPGSVEHLLGFCVDELFGVFRYAFLEILPMLCVLWICHEGRVFEISIVELDLMINGVPGILASLCFFVLWEGFFSSPLYYLFCFFFALTKRTRRSPSSILFLIFD